MPQTLELQIADAGLFLTVLVALVIFPSLVVFALEFKKTPALKIGESAMTFCIEKGT